eukprot:1457781-Prymnesium_polylepis.2
MAHDFRCGAIYCRSMLTYWQACGDSCARGARLRAAQRGRSRCRRVRAHMSQPRDQRKNRARFLPIHLRLYFV